MSKRGEQSRQRHRAAAAALPVDSGVCSFFKYPPQPLLIVTALTPTGLTLHKCDNIAEDEVSGLLRKETGENPAAPRDVT